MQALCWKIKLYMENTLVDNRQENNIVFCHILVLHSFQQIYNSICNAFIEFHRKYFLRILQKDCKQSEME